MTTIAKKFRCKCRVALWLSLFLLSISLSGCMLAAAGAVAGAGAYAYYQGNYSQMHTAEFGRTWQATKSALSDLALPVISEHHEGLKGSIKSSLPDGTSISIDLEELPRIMASDGHQTEVNIRVGTFGDQAQSQKIQQQIQAHIVGQNVTAPPANRLPPLNSTVAPPPAATTSKANSTVPPPGTSAPPASGNQWKPASANGSQTLPP